jgi:hypothetical protein
MNEPDSYLDSEIRARLGRYLRGEDTLDEFREWFTPATWDVGQSGNSAAVELSSRVHHIMAEYLTGTITRGRMNERLRPLRETYIASYGDMQADLRTRLTDAVRTEPFAAVGRQL